MSEGPRERRRRLTAAEVERVAIELFAERGFDAVTVDEIAAAANISRRTFFRYYPSKEDVVVSVGDIQLALLKEGLASRPRDEPVLTAIRNTFIEMATRFEMGRDEYIKRWEIVTASPTLAARAYGAQWEWDETLTEFVGGRLGLNTDHDLRPRLIGSTIMAALRAAIAAWTLGEPDLVSVLTESFDMVNDGLARLAED